MDGTQSRPAVVAIGVGSERAGDDAAGLEAVRRVRASGRVATHELQGDLTGLLDLWRGYEAAVLLDAMRSGAPPGSVRRLCVGRDPLPRGLRAGSSTHAVTLPDAIELGRTLGQAPPHVVVYAVEGRCFRAGAEMSAEVSSAIPGLAREALFEALRLARRG